ncbi:MAG: HlyC/CorC family transporter [Pseudomonadota bacterium]|nr:HlyC/CorC family transporter [Pseudomonadota bacterium]
MDSFPLSVLLLAVAGLILASAFFSSSETGMMALNRYRLKHLSEAGNPGARRASRLLKRPDRLIGLILIGNNFVNNMAASLATMIAVRLLGDQHIALAASVATITLTLVVLVFAEVTPKTWAALHPERIAFPASWLLTPLLRLLSPLVALVNGVSNGLLRLLGVRVDQVGPDRLSLEELRTVVHESGEMVPRRHHNMLLGILDLEHVAVNDIMVPRGDVVGIDLNDHIDDIIEQLRSSAHTRLPVYRGDINDVVGILHLRNAARFLTSDTLTHEVLIEVTRDPYFVPESTPLHIQLFNFQHEKRRIGIVVDEYGDVQGIVTLEDILEEIVGEFTTNIAETAWDIAPQPDGSYLIEGSAVLREINRSLHWTLPIDGPKTLNGLVLEHLETIPDASLCLRIEDYQLEIVQTKDNQVKTVRVRRCPVTASAVAQRVEPS